MPQPLLEARATPAGTLMLRVTGQVDFNTVPALLEQSRSLLGGTGPVTLDLAAVSAVNSAGLALLLEWKRVLGQQGRQLELVNLPDSLRNIAHVNELEHILSIDAGQDRKPS